MKNYWFDAEVFGIPYWMVILFCAVVVYGGVKFQRGFDKDKGVKTKIDWKPIVQWVIAVVVIIILIMIGYNWWTKNIA